MRSRGRQGLGLALLLLAAMAGAMLPVACGDDSVAPASSSSGVGGGDAGCYDGPPLPLFELVIRDASGALPPDLTLAVKWSAGQEPVFMLGDPSTWLTLEQGANVVCDVPGADGGAPAMLEELRCELWTSGPTEITITGGALDPYEDTLTPLEQPDCEEPLSSEVEVVLGLPPDAGR